MKKTEQLAEKYADINYNEYGTDEFWGEVTDRIPIKRAYRNGAQDMLERVCKYLLNIDYDSSRYIDFWEDFNEELFVNDLRKAMEEQRL